MKWCSGHKDWHDESAFHKDCTRSDGLSYRCKAWKAEYNRRINRKEAHKQYDGNNEYRKQYQKDHPETSKAATDKWRAENPDRVKEYNRYTDYRREFHDRRIGRIIEGDSIDKRAVWGRDEGYCRIKLVCDGVFVPFEEMHLDHVIPLSKGGTHTWNNVQTSCAPCNLAKGSRILERIWLPSALA